MIDFIKDSWTRNLKRIQQNPNFSQELDEIGKETTRLVLSLSYEQQKRVERSYYFYSFDYVLQENKGNIIIDFKPFYRIFDLKICGVDKAFFKNFVNWTKLNDEDKALLERIVEPYYDNTIEEFYKHYWFEYLEYNQRGWDRLFEE